MEDRRYERKTLMGNKEKIERYSFRLLLLDLFRLLFLAFGIVGIVSVVHNFPGVEFDMEKVFLYCTGALVALFILYRINAWFFALSSSLGILFLARQIYISWPQLSEQGKRLYDWFMAIDQAPGDLTLIFLYGALVLSVFIFHLDIVARLHLPTYILITLAFLLPPLFGSSLSTTQMVLLGASQFFFMADVATARGLKTGFHSSGKRSVIAFKSSIAAVILFGLSLLLAIPLANKYEGRIYEEALSIEERIEDALNAAYSNDEGLINRGSNFHNGEIVFSAALNREPEDSIYLIRYRGSSYDGSRWASVNEDGFHQQISSSHEMDLGEVRSLFNTLYFQWNYVGVSGVDGNVRQLSIFSPEMKYAAMRPYNAIRPIATSQGEDGNYSSLYYYYEEAELTELPDDAEKGWSGMALFANLYGDYAYANYTSYPERQLPNLKAFVEENPLEDLNEITSFIVYTLGSNAKYTVTPGMAPFNRDIVEHFLFNSGLGYCQHYASTATLMYRMYGIPARYVTGFRLDPDDYAIKESGQLSGLFLSDDGEEVATSEEESGPLFVSDVPDSSAHAWVEIYIKGYGWVPVDVTPSASGRFYPKYPGFDYRVMDSIQASHGWLLVPEEVTAESSPEAIAENTPQEEETEAIENTEVPEEEPAPNGDPQVSEENNPGVNHFPDLINEAETPEDQIQVNPNSGKSSMEMLKALFQFLKRVLLVAVLIGVLLSGFLLYRRIILKKYETSDVKVLFQRLVSLLADSGLGLPKRLDDPGLPSLVSDYLKNEEGYTPVTLDQAKRVQAIVTRATFSPKPVSQEDLSFVRGLYLDAASKLYDEQSWFKKLVFKYIKVYL